MKKITAIILALTMLLSFPMVVFADGTTTLTTTVPAATYTLNIPADQEIGFGKTSTEIGTLTVTESSGFASGKNLKVSISYTNFTSDNVNTTIPFNLSVNSVSDNSYELNSGDYLIFSGLPTGSVTSAPYSPADINHQNIKSIYVKVASQDWGLALAGEYTATITFTSEVVIATK